MYVSEEPTECGTMTELKEYRFPREEALASCISSLPVVNRVSLICRLAAMLSYRSEVTVLFFL